jgi:hypothetical protein
MNRAWAHYPEPERLAPDALRHALVWLSVLQFLTYGGHPWPKAHA